MLEGVDYQWALEDPDLDAARRDKRWGQLLPFLKHTAEYWARRPVQRDALRLPDGYDGKFRHPCCDMVTRHHGNGSLFERDRRRAAELGVAIVGVDATFASSARRYRWSENAELDLQRVDAALEKFAHHANFDRERVLLYGFSQGAYVAAELVINYPDRFAGAFLASAGGRTPSTTLASPPQTELRSHTVHCYVGGGEDKGSIQFTQDFCEAARRRGAHTLLRIDPNQARHTYPPDFEKVFAEWVRAALKTRQKK